MLHVQKRKRLQVADRFQENLDKVQETIEQALASLPEQQEEGGGEGQQGLVSSEEIEAMLRGAERDGGGGFNADDVDRDGCANVDRVMCQAADEMAAREIAAAVAAAAAAAANGEEGGGEKS